MAARRLPGGVRARLTTLAVLVVGSGLVAAALLVLSRVHDDLLESAKAAATQRAADVAQMAATGRLPPALPATDESNPVVQVVDSHGTVLSASPELRGLGALLGRRPVDQPVTAQIGRLPIADDQEYWVIGVPVETPAGEPLTVYAATSLEPVQEGTDATLSAMVAAFPVLIIVVGGTAWMLVGRALRSVEAIRTQVAEITVTELDRRVPEPPGDDELARLARTMNAMLARLEQANDRQRQFVSDASHELRSPLAAIRTRTEVGLAHPDAADWKALTRDVHRESDRLHRLVEALLTLSRADHGSGGAESDEIDLDELVLAEVEPLRARGQVTVDLSGLSAVRLRARTEQLRVVIRNLLENAERYATTTVAVTTSADQSTADLIVWDDGPGIPPNDRERVFDRFVRLDAARAHSNGGGHGIGLAIVRGIVGGHGGQVWIAESASGAEFHVRLPRHTRTHT
ncbi:HAMP domain-containing protein [Streptosporangiaceae bacterium NEAU-GS5]|nr:HAMP domain-containing protein [Streptosporangiaceae bacterium NEAU-GS5]